MASKRKRAVLKSASTKATQRWTISGFIRKQPPKPITLATSEDLKKNELPHRKP